MVGVAYGRPLKLVLSFRIKGYGFHDRFHGLWELGFN